jgi:ADP-ribosyl-[dinitrogen reductase] hydrolase
MKTNPVHAALFGVAIGDALGVPAEFKNREALKLDPVQDFIGYKSHGQPPGTFSDDSSLTFCLA